MLSEYSVASVFTSPGWYKAFTAGKSREGDTTRYHAHWSTLHPSSPTAIAFEHRISRQRVSRRLKEYRIWKRRPYRGMLLTQPRWRNMVRWARQVRRSDIRDRARVMLSDVYIFADKLHQGSPTIWRRWCNGNGNNLWRFENKAGHHPRQSHCFGIPRWHFVNRYSIIYPSNSHVVLSYSMITPVPIQQDSRNNTHDLPCLAFMFSWHGSYWVLVGPLWQVTLKTTCTTANHQMIEICLVKSCH